MLLRNIFISFKKIFTSKGFYICAAFSLILFFCADIYTDPASRSRYSVIRAIMSFSREEMLKDFGLWSANVMKGARSGWITLFIPIITAFCFTPMITDQRQAKAETFQLFRSSVFRFSLSRFIAGTFSAGLSAALGYGVFCLCAGFIFPFPEELEQWQAEMIGGFNIFAAIGSVWLYGAFWSIPAMLCGSFLNNKYIIMCLPFFMKYALSQGYQLLFQRAWGDYENINYSLADFINTTSPDALLYLQESESRAFTILFFAAAAAVFLTVYLLICRSGKRRGRLI